MEMTEDEANRVRLVLARCDTNGTDRVRALKDLGLLTSAAERRNIQAGTLRQAADLLDQTTVRQLTRSNTSLDTKVATARWLRQQADELTKEERS